MNVIAEILLPTTDLHKEMEFFTFIGFRLEQIFPADDPAVAVMSGHGLRIRIDRNAAVQSPTIQILTDDPEDVFEGKNEHIAPNGCRILVRPLQFSLTYPKTLHKFEVRPLRDQEPWVIGRAGMLYRDLIPDRLGGSIIASHIRIPDGGPVPDMVHYHTIGFQLIFCYHGWVRLVYEDQGPPFILKAGDCVIQPPEIRHRVLEASDNLEVIEIGVPADSMTTIDHEMELPTMELKPDREFQGQRFVRHELEKATWQPWYLEGFEYRETGISDATRGVASVQVGRATGAGSMPGMMSHNAEILFLFVMQGAAGLEAEGHEKQNVQKGDAIVIPPGMMHRFDLYSADFELLKVRLPGE